MVESGNLACLKGMNPFSPGFKLILRMDSSIFFLTASYVFNGSLLPLGGIWQGEQLLTMMAVARIS